MKSYQLSLLTIFVYLQNFTVVRKLNFIIDIIKSDGSRTNSANCKGCSYMTSLSRICYNIMKKKVYKKIQKHNIS